MIAIVDYGLGNLKSVQRAFEYTKSQCVITRDKKELSSAAGMVLPGVGAFGQAKKNLTDLGLVPLIREWIGSGRPFLGICLGYQLLFDTSDEGEYVCEGLGIIGGAVKRFPAGTGLKVPQIGWNSIEIKTGSAIFKGLENGVHVYFVHSYYGIANERETVLAKTDYGVVFDSAVMKHKAFAMQFHPEKSGSVGLRIIRNFCDIVYEGRDELK